MTPHIFEKARNLTALAEGLSGQKIRQIALLVAVAAILAVPPIFVNHPIGYIPFITYLLIVLMSWGYLRIIARGFTVEHEFAEGSCVRGNSVELPIILKNRSRLPILRARPQVYVKNPYGSIDHEVLAVAMVDALGDDCMNTKVRLGHTGVYTAGLQGVVLYDPLMLFQAYASVEGQATLVSTPKDFAVDVVEFSDMAVHESSAPVRTVLSDNVDYAGTRDYEYGDPMKSVHWKLSARMSHLQTRLFEASVNTKLSVIMDFHSPDYEDEELLECCDAIVEMALAVMRLALRRNIETTLCYVDKDGEALSRSLPQAEEMDNFVSSLPRLSPEVSGRNALGLAERESDRFGGSDSIVFCTSSLSKELVARAVSMRGGHLSVTVILAVPRGSARAFYHDNQGIVAELSSAGVPCIVLSDASDLEQGPSDE